MLIPDAFRMDETRLLFGHSECIKTCKECCFLRQNSIILKFQSVTPQEESINEMSKLYCIKQDGRISH